MTAATPADVLARRRPLILAGDADGFAGLFAPDGVIEASFSGPPVEPEEWLTDWERPYSTGRPR